MIEASDIGAIVAQLDDVLPGAKVRCVRRIAVTAAGVTEIKTEPFDASIGQRRQNPQYTLEGVAPGDIVTLTIHWAALLAGGEFSPTPFSKNDEVDVIRGDAAPVRHQIADVSYDPTETICTLTCVRAYA